MSDFEPGRNAIRSEYTYDSYLSLQNTACDFSCDSPHSADLYLRLHAHVLGLHRLVGDDGGRGAAGSHVVEHDILHRDTTWRQT